MKTEMLAMLKNEARLGFQYKAERHHSLWRPIMEEYRLRTWEAIWSYVTKSVTNISTEAVLFSDGRKFKLHNIIRKCKALMTFQDPEAVIEETNPQDEAIASLLEHDFEAHRRAIRANKFSRDYVLWACLTGTACGKIGVKGEFMPGEDPWSESIPRGIEQAESERLWPDGAMTEYGLPTSGKNLPVAKVIPTNHVAFDPAGNVGKIQPRRIYHKQYRVVRDIWQDSRYLKEARRQISGAFPKDVDESIFLGVDNTGLAAEARIGEVVECFDIPSQQYCAFSFESDKELREWTPYPYQLDNWSPYFFMTLIDDPESNWGIPYAFLSLPACRALNNARMQVMASISKDGKVLYLVNGTYYDEEDIMQWNSLPSNSFVLTGKMPNFQEDSERGVHKVEFGGPPEQLLMAEARLEQTANEESGLDDPTRGAYSPGIDATATEIATRQQHQGITIEDMRNPYEEAIEDVYVGLAQIRLQTFGDRELIRVVGDDPRLWFWIPVERTRVTNEFTLRVVLGSSEKRDKLVTRKQWIELLPRVLEIRNLIRQEQIEEMQGVPRGTVNLEEIARVTLEKFDERRTADRILRRRDPKELMMRLLQQHGMFPVSMSPELMRQIQGGAMGQNSMGMMQGQGMPMGQMGQGGMPGMQNNVVSFEERNRIKQPGQPMLGGFSQDTAAGINGRALSELNQMV